MRHTGRKYGPTVHAARRATALVVHHYHLGVERWHIGDLGRASRGRSFTAERLSEEAKGETEEGKERERRRRRSEEEKEEEENTT